MTRLGILLGIALLTPVALAQRPFAFPSSAQGKPGPMPAPEKPKLDPLPMPVEEIIRRFAEKEAEFKLARDEYSYKQSVLLREYDESGEETGEFRRRSEVIFLPSGERHERVTYEPPPTLRRINVTPEDLHDLEHIQPFVLTTEDLPKYHIEYQGREKADELTTYVFSVRPKRIEKGQRYFEGTIWVDDQDLQIVKTRGKAVPDIREGGQENLFPMFETYREHIDGKYWFPTYTRADDVLRFSTAPVRIRVIIRYTNYKKREVTSRIVGAEPVKPFAPRPAAPGKPEETNPRPPELWPL